LLVTGHRICRRDFNRRRSQRDFIGSRRHSSAGGRRDSEYVGEATAQDPVEREILAHEVEQLSLQAIQDGSGEPDRDRLIFQLYYFDGLSTGQIAACKGVGLSKTGVEKILNRLKNKVQRAVRTNSIEARQ
jgi:DNA-directed RNA polymerase specialized sigma subunit